MKRSTLSVVSTVLVSMAVLSAEAPGTASTVVGPNQHKPTCIARGVVTGSHVSRCVRPGGKGDSDSTISTPPEDLPKLPGVTIGRSRAGHRLVN